MNIFTHKGDGIILPDLHVASTEGKVPSVLVSIVEPRTDNVSPARAWMTPTEAIMMAHAILKHYGEE